MFMLDIALQTIFPVDFQYQRLFVVFNMGIIALMLDLRKKDFLVVFSIAFVVGLGLDITRYGYFFLSALSLSLTMILIRVWSNQLNESVIELVILAVMSVFIKELVQYLLLLLSGLTSLYPSNWFIYRGFLTLLIHIPLSLVVIYFYRLKNQFLQRGQVARTKMESTLYRELRKTQR